MQPYVHARVEKYRDHDQAVIGVHAPEFPFEHNLDNLRRAAKKLRVAYLIAIDNKFAIWRTFNFHY